MELPSLFFVVWLVPIHDGGSTSEEQQLLGEGRLPGVGMADDGERASPADLVFEGCRRAQRISTQLRACSGSGPGPDSAGCRRETNSPGSPS